MSLGGCFSDVEFSGGRHQGFILVISLPPPPPTPRERADHNKPSQHHDHHHYYYYSCYHRDISLPIPFSSNNQNERTKKTNAVDTTKSLERSDENSLALNGNRSSAQQSASITMISGESREETALRMKTLWGNWRSCPS